jgi:subfamily B ATP-binding cassette protein MsbA
MAPDARMLASAALKHPRLVSTTLALGFASALLNGVGLALVVPTFMSFLGDATFGNAPRFLQPLLALFPTAHQAGLLFATVLGCIVLKNAFAFASDYSSGCLRREIACDLRDEALRIALEVDIDYYSRIKLGDFMARIHWDTVKGAGAVMIALRMAVIGCTIAVFLGLMLALAWKLTLVSAVLLAGVAAANQSLMRLARRLGALVSERFGEYSQALLETSPGSGWSRQRALRSWKRSAYRR